MFTYSITKTISFSLCIAIPMTSCWYHPVSTLSSSSPRNMPPLSTKLATAEFHCRTCSNKHAHYSQGLDTYRIPMALYELNRIRLVQAMISKLTTTNNTPIDDNHDHDNEEVAQKVQGIILLEGGKQTTRYDTDHEPIFRQESYFHWAFGVTEPNVYGAISLPLGNTTLFIPQYGLDYEIFCGSSPQIKHIRTKYGVDQVLPLDQLATFLQSELQSTNNTSTNNNSTNKRLHLLSGRNTDSGNMAIPAHYKGIEHHINQITTDYLFECISNLRVYKTQAEINVMRYTNWVSSMAHVEVMRSCQPGQMEYQLESLFQHHTYTHGGCRHMSYTCICACGPNPAILHYGHAGAPNNRKLQKGDLALLDMGAEYHCYASDITCSFPVDGIFTNDQRIIYEAVLDAQICVIQAIRPGVSWIEMHQTAERAILKGLVKAGILSGDIHDMMAVNLGAIFMPHGLGHLIGIDTHDVGGYSKGTPLRSDQPGLNKLRTARILEQGMVLTVEPGCYFIDILLDMALKDSKQKSFINKTRLNDFRGFGGIRLEDGLWVTEEGCENLTMCPRSVEEVIGVMSGEMSWPPKFDQMPELRRSWVSRKEGQMVPIQISTNN